MKLVTNKTVRLTEEEAKKLLTRFVEKKAGKKVTDVVFSSPDGFSFVLEAEEADLTEGKEA